MSCSVMFAWVAPALPERCLFYINFDTNMLEIVRITIFNLLGRRNVSGGSSCEVPITSSSIDEANKRN
jgi:hypothetical protein